MTDDGKLVEGARNLLQQCGEFGPDGEVLLVCENPAFGWFDEVTPAVVAREAERLGLTPRLIEVGAPFEGLPPAVAEVIEQHSNCIFFARIGDQDRFAEVPAGRTKVMCYIRDAKMLASDYGTASHKAMRIFKKAVDKILLDAGRIEISCPLGTRVTGTISEAARASGSDVGIRRFPLGVPQPVDALEFGGKVALARYLTPTGSRAYDPAFLEIRAPAFAHIVQGRIEFFSGDPETVRGIEAHYERVSDLFDIDPWFVHSWHAGIHPGCSYDRDAGADPDCWSNTAFSNPRVLHFHTCGAYAPGEICWMVLDHSVRIDGVALWEDGKMHPERFESTRACLEDWPELLRLFEKPAVKVGV